MTGAVVTLNDEVLNIRFTMRDLAKVTKMLGKPFMMWLTENANFANPEGILKVLAVGLDSGGNPKDKEYLENEVDASALNDILAALMGAIGGAKGKRRMAAVFAQEEAEITKMERETSMIMGGDDSAKEGDGADTAPGDDSPLA